jgi:large subunit ribosomal protein L30
VWHRTRGPQHTPKAFDGEGMVEIRQVKSEIGHSWRLRRTLEAIGLRHHQDVVVREFNPSLAGQLLKVRHLVQVTPVESAK